MPRGGFSKAARNKRWRELYGKPTGKTRRDGRPEVYTYRLLAKQYRVTPNTVWFALHPDRKPKRYERAAQPAKVTHPLSVRLALSRAQHGALKARAQAERISMMELGRRIIFEGAAPIEGLADIAGGEEGR